MKTLSLKIPSGLALRLQNAAKKRKATKSALVRQAIEAFLEPQGKPRSGSVLDRIRHLVGCVEGPGDLSYNPKYMEGFGK